MTIVVKAYANADDVLIAWQPDQWPADWVGFQLERRNDTTQQVTIMVNRIPPKPANLRYSRPASRRISRRFGAASGPITTSSQLTASPIAHGDERPAAALSHRCDRGVDWTAPWSLPATPERAGGLFQPGHADVPASALRRQRVSDTSLPLIS